MRIHVHGMNGDLKIELLDADNLRAFSVQLGSGVQMGEAQGQFSEILRFESNEQAWVNQGWLRSEFLNKAGAGLEYEFDIMIESAGRHGWTHAVTGEIAVHVESGTDIGTEVNP